MELKIQVFLKNQITKLVCIFFSKKKLSYTHFSSFNSIHKNMKNFSLSMLFILTTSIAIGQAIEEPTQPTSLWKTSFDFKLDFNQAAFSKSWQGGGVNSVAFGSHSNIKLDYKRNKLSSQNSIQLLYGVVSAQNHFIKKTNDKLFLETNLNYNYFKHWRINIGLNFLTQFTPGYSFKIDTATKIESRTLISNFLMPAFITFNLGTSYKLADYFELVISPLSSRITIVNDTTLIQNVPKNYGVERGEISRVEQVAMQIVANFNKEILPNTKLSVRYRAFGNYEKFSLINTDHRMDFLLSAQVNKYIATSISLIAIYDDDISKNMQLSQSLGIGFLYKFKNH